MKTIKCYCAITWITFSLFLFAYTSCRPKTAVDSEKLEPVEQNQDTVIIKVVNNLNESYDVELYSKSLSYVWVSGKDTLPFRINVREYRSDSTFSIGFSHRNPILFSEVLKRLDECMALIAQDFEIMRCEYISMKSPIYYPDVVKALSESYMQQVGRKNGDYEQMNKLLAGSNLHSDLNKKLAKHGLEIKSYGIEKFQFVPKRSVAFDHPNVNVTEYPDYIIYGMGMSVWMQAK